MGRTADEVLTHHIQAMLTMDFENAPSDYSEKLAAITRLDGQNRTLGYDSLTAILNRSAKIASALGLDLENAAARLRTLFRCGVGDYVVFVCEMKPFSSFACFNYIVEDGKAVYVTGYAKTPPMPSLGVKAHPFEPGVETMAAMDAHLEHLREKDIDALAADYAEDAIVITNLAAKPFVGAEEIKRYCRQSLEKAGPQFAALTAPGTKYNLKQAVAELGCIGFQHKENRQYGVLTQRVRGGKIIFESVIFQGAQPLF